MVCYFLVEVLIVLLMVVWLVIFNGEVVGMDSLMLWSYDWLDEGMKFMFLFFEVG